MIDGLEDLFELMRLQTLMLVPVIGLVCTVIGGVVYAVVSYL